MGTFLAIAGVTHTCASLGYPQSAFELSPCITAVATSSAEVSGNKGVAIAIVLWHLASQDTRSVVLGNSVLLHMLVAIYVPVFAHARTLPERVRSNRVLPNPSGDIFAIRARRIDD